MMRKRFCPEHKISRARASCACDPVLFGEPLRKRKRYQFPYVKWVRPIVMTRHGKSDDLPYVTPFNVALWITLNEDFSES